MAICSEPENAEPLLKFIIVAAVSVILLELPAVTVMFWVMMLGKKMFSAFVMLMVPGSLPVVTG